jgi:linearmycin/streptolysin S transport system permease protein
MTAALVIALVDLKRLFRDRGALFWIFIGPAIFTTFFGLMFRQGPPRPPVLLLVNQDQDDYTARLLTVLLREDGVDVRPATAIVADELTLVVPEGFTAGLSKGKPVKPLLHAGKEETNAERNLSFKVTKALTTLYVQANPAETPHDLDAAGLKARLARTAVLGVRESDLGVPRREMTAGFQRSVASYLVMFVFLNLVVSGAGIAEERATGKLRRMFIAPVSRRAVALGKLLARFAVGWIQAAYLLILGVLIFRIRWAEHPWVLFGFLSIFALAAASLGMLVGTLFRDPGKCVAAALWTSILLSPLGGLWWPLEIVGPTMRTVGYFVPTGWAMEAVNTMLAFGAGARDVAPYALALAALFGVTFTVAVRRLTA